MGELYFGRLLGTHVLRRSSACTPTMRGEEIMRRLLLSISISAVCFVGCPGHSAAQEVIHALTGSVSSINSKAKTITIFQDNGTQGVFAEPGSKVRFELDKKIADESTAASSFMEQGAYAIVFYYGSLNNPTIVALKNLGKGPFAATEGTVTRFDNRDRTMSVSDHTGAIRTFTINADTVAEGDMGVVEGSKFRAQKGDQVRVVSEILNGVATALFVKDM
jgi:hypothetical protein